jgi:DNA polymerase-3 subunit delta'
MRPFEAARRVYLVLGAHLMNEDAADALLKDLEEPPDYAVVVLIADDLGLLPPTILSRCQLIPFRRLSQRAVKAHLSSRGLQGEELEALARVAGGRLDRAERLLDADAGKRRTALIELARSVYRDADFDPASASRRVSELAQERADEARAAAEADAPELETQREREQRVRRAARGAERAEVLDALEVLSTWYRDLVVTIAGADRAVVNSDRLAELAEDGAAERSSAAEQAAEAVRETWRSFEFQVQTGLALEALFARLRRELAAAPQATR